MRVLYGSASWPQGATRDGIALSALVLEGAVANELRSEAGYLRRSYSTSSVVAPDPSFIVEASVADGSRQAHEVLVTWLAGLSTAKKMPALREWNLALGDVGFVGPSGASPRTLSWIAFVRGNVAVRILATDPQREPALDLASIAGKLDAAILGRSVLAPGTTPARPLIARFVPSKTTVIAGENIGLDVRVIDPYGGVAHLEWVVGGPGQGYVEAAADGTPKLHTTGPGLITLTLQVTGSTGTFAQSSVEITVRHE